MVSQMVKNLPAVQKTHVQYLDQEDPMEEGPATHSSSLASRIPWTEEPGRLQSMGPQRVGYNWATNTHTQTQTHTQRHTHTHTQLGDRDDEEQCTTLWYVWIRIHMTWFWIGHEEGLVRVDSLISSLSTVWIYGDTFYWLSCTEGGREELQFSFSHTESELLRLPSEAFGCILPASGAFSGVQG